MFHHCERNSEKLPHLTKSEPVSDLAETDQIFQ